MSGKLFCAAVAALFAFAAPLLHAASFDCAQAADSVEKAVCADASLAQLDVDLGAAYRVALDAKGVDRTALQRDEQNWIADRDEIARHYENDPLLRKDLKSVLGEVYRGRIEFLRALADARRESTPLLDSVREALPLLSRPAAKADDAGLLAALAARGAGIVLDEEIAIPAKPGAEADAQAMVKALPGTPNDALRQALDRFDYGMGGVGMTWLQHAAVGSAYQVAGTAHCRQQVLWELVPGGTVRLIDTPDILVGECSTRTNLALIDARFAAVREFVPDIHTLDLSLTPRDEGAWRQTQRLLIRFDNSLRVEGSYCENGACADELVALARSRAERFARKPLAAVLAMKLSAQDADLYGRMQAAAASRSAPVGTMPQFERGKSGRGYYGMTGYDTEAEFFAAKFNGELLLGRIGHGHVGWREDAMWLVGFWRWREGMLEPLAGIAFAPVRGKALLAVPLPAREECGGLKRQPCAH